MVSARMQGSDTTRRVVPSVISRISPCGSLSFGSSEDAPPDASPDASGEAKAAQDSISSSASRIDNVRIGFFIADFLR